MRGLLALMTVAALASAGEAADDGPTRAEPPEASFQVIDGWLYVRVMDGGKPMPGVRVRCLVGSTEWASGETDAAGKGAFPRPTGDWCQLVFDLGAGPSAPVPLTFLPDGGAVPISSPVRDGTAVCCVVPSGPPRLSTRATEDESEPNVWLVPAAALGVTVAAIWWLRTPTRAGSPAARFSKRRSRHER